MAANGGNDLLFVADNSDENWKGLDYLREVPASQFDIATGNFEVGRFSRSKVTGRSWTRSVS